MRFFITLSTIITLTLTPLISASNVINLDDSNFESETAGKIAFVKFFAPWCGHCKSMAPDWIKLSTVMRSHNDNILIAEVDCTTDETTNICETQGVEGFPTLKYGDASYMEDYEGERTYDALLAFAQSDQLKLGCSPTNTAACSDAEKGKIEYLNAMSVEELETLVGEIDKVLEEEEEAFEKQTDTLEEEYTGFVSDTDGAKRALKEKSDYNLLKAVTAVQAEQGAGDEL